MCVTSSQSDLSRHHPVFVFGAPYSGAELLASLMLRALNVSFGMETHFVLSVHRKLRKYGSLEVDANMARLIDDIAKERCFERWMLRFGFVIDRTRIFEQVGRHRTYSRILLAIFEQLGKYHGTGRWCDRTLEYHRGIPELATLFPAARFIHVVRDGRDVALSTCPDRLDSASVYRAAIEWRRTLRRIDDAATSIPADTLMTVHFEELIEDPVDALERVGRFLGVANVQSVPVIASGAMPAFAAPPLRRGQHARASGRATWSADMSSAHRQLYEAVAGDALEQAGYSTRHHTQKAPRMTERIYWRTGALVRRVLARA